MRNRFVTALKSFLRKPLALIPAGILIVAFAFTLARLSSLHAASANAGALAQSAACRQPAVASYVAMRKQAGNVTIPAGEPAVVAVVYGQNITAVYLETRVNLVVANDKLQLASATSPLPADVSAYLNKPVAVIRQETLASIIQDQVLIQTGKDRGLYVSVAAAHHYMQGLIASFKSLPASSTAAVQFQATLCENNLTTQTFLTDPTTTHSYQDGLTIAAVRNAFIHTLPLSVQDNQNATRNALDASINQLVSAAHVTIYLPGATA